MESGSSSHGICLVHNTAFLHVGWNVPIFVSIDEGYLPLKDGFETSVLWFGRIVLVEVFQYVLREALEELEPVKRFLTMSQLLVHFLYTKVWNLLWE